MIDYFHVLLPRNVKINHKNKPYLYETELSKPLDLPGELAVAHINISDAHNWKNSNKSNQYFLLRQPIEGVNFQFAPENEKVKTDVYYLILKQAQFQGWVVYRAPQITRGN